MLSWLRLCHSPFISVLMKLYAEPSKFQLINGFREDFLKLANHKQELPMVAMFVNGLGQNEDSL